MAQPRFEDVHGPLIVRDDDGDTVVIGLGRLHGWRRELKRFDDG